MAAAAPRLAKAKELMQHCPAGRMQKCSTGRDAGRVRAGGRGGKVGADKAGKVAKAGAATTGGRAYTARTQPLKTLLS